MTTNEQSMGSHYTPLKDDDANVNRVCAELLVYSGDTHPSLVTEALRLTPTRIVATGEASPPNSRGVSRIGTLNGWFLSSEEHVLSKDIRRHLDWLIGKLQPCREKLRVLQDKDGMRMYVSCVLWTDSDSGSATLWPEQMRGLSELNLECTFAFADYSDPPVIS
jgi:Domain of unknown function (DUF4279)